jgi:DNA-binding beta-propeller fold protein YncE
MAGSAAHTFVALVLVGAVAAAEPIPESKRVEAVVVRTIAAPADQPMKMPTDVAADAQGHVYVADGVNDRVLRFDAKGSFEAAITGAPDVRLNEPIGLSLDAKGNLWVADSGDARLVVLSPTGKPIATLHPTDLEAEHPFNPTDVIVTGEGERAYIVDNDNHRIVVYERETKEWRALGSFGRALGQFRWPFMIAAAPDGYLYVSETVGARIQRISPGERWAGQVSGWGVALGRVYRPKGVSVDAAGRLYISDSTLGVVQVFNDRGGIVGVLVDGQGQPLRFKHPMGMCFDSAGLLYVVELEANRVAVVSLRERSASADTPSASGSAQGGGGEAP